MGLFSSAKATLAARKLAEERLYEIAVEEIAANNIRPGLWAKALAETDGNEAAAKARYIKLRVETIGAEADLQEHAASRTETENNTNRTEAAESTDSETFGVLIVAFLVTLVIGGLLFAAITQA